MIYQLKLTNYLLPGEAGTPVERLLYDSRVDDLSVYDAKAVVEVDAAGSITFTVPKNHPYYSDIKIGRSWVDFIMDGVEYIVGGKVATITKDLFGNALVTVYGASICLHDVYLPDIEMVNSDTRALINIINAQIPIQTENRFSLDNVQVPFTELYLLYGTAWDALVKLRDYYANSGVSWRFVANWYPIEGYRGDFFSSYAGVHPLHIKVGTNLIDYQQEINEADIYSGIMPLGAETNIDFHGEKRHYQIVEPPDVGIVWDNTLVTRYGRKVVKRIYDDINQAGTAISNRASSELTQLHTIRKKVKVHAIDIQRTVAAYNRFRLMYVLTMEGSATVEPEQFIIKRIEYDLNNPANDTIELTNYV